MSDYIIAMDGGGTCTQAIIAKGEEVLFETTLPATNYHNVGKATIETVFKVGLERLCEKAGIAKEDLSAWCIGAAGVDTAQDEKVVFDAIRSTGFEGKIKVVNDGYIALVASHQNEEGAMIISGTGSIAMGMNGKKLVRVGGWGHLIGDEGSAYTLSRDAFQAMTQSVDGRGEKTLLTEKIMSHLKFSDPSDLIQYVYAEGRDKSEIAQIAPVVIESYHLDPVAKNIVDHNINELVKMVHAVSKEMPTENFKLSACGSVLVKNDFYFQLFQNALKKKIPTIEVFQSNCEAVEGAKWLALKMLERR